MGANLGFGSTSFAGLLVSSCTSNRFHALEMATFAFKPYTYMPTPPRFKSATSRPQTCLEASQHLRQAPAHQAE
ncbi:hypothetical protein BDZ45DRAFT_670922 [Acephala macrosclerotiorum]|nr:hypothetical protein BDZ45DRAFT_670922 [Acephala macrosclerotiorum]